MKAFTYLLILLSVTTIFARKPDVSPEIIQTSTLEIRFIEVNTYGKDYIIEVIVKNNSDIPQTFDAGAIEIVDQETGITYYSVTKGKEVVSVPSYLSDLINVSTINPGRAINGRIWIATPTGKANRDPKDIYFDGKKIATMD